MQESGPERCERCGGELRRVFFPAGIIFKGSGFYKTDSRSARLVLHVVLHPARGQAVIWQRAEGELRRERR